MLTDSLITGETPGTTRGFVTKNVELVLCGLACPFAARPQVGKDVTSACLWPVERSRKWRPSPAAGRFGAVFAQWPPGSYEASIAIDPRDKARTVYPLSEPNSSKHSHPRGSRMARERGALMRGLQTKFVVDVAYALEAFHPLQYCHTMNEEMAAGGRMRAFCDAERPVERGPDVVGNSRSIGNTQPRSTSSIDTGIPWIYP